MGFYLTGSSPSGFYVSLLFRFRKNIKTIERI